jgi:hypothetical protein
MELHKSNFLAINTLPEVQGIKIQWLAPSERMNDEQFKQEILGEKKAIETAKPTKIFADTLQMKFTINPELQQWHNEQIFPAFQAVGMKKLAILISEDLFAQVAIEQLVDEGASNELQSRYFDKEEDAIAWLKA